MTAQPAENRNPQLRTWTLILAIVSIVSLFSVTMTTLAWGTGDTTAFFLFLYPALVVSTILVAARRRLGFVLTLVIAIAYALLFMRNIGEYFVFDSNNYVLVLVLVLPFMAIIALIPVTTTFLCAIYKKRKVITIISISVTLSIPIFSIAERANMNYTDSVFTEFKIDGNDAIKLSCKLQPSDTRIFYLSTSSQELVAVAKSEGTYLIDYYYVANTKIVKNYQFRKLQSLTITKLNNTVLRQPLTWKAEEIRGDISFLEP